MTNIRWDAKGVPHSTLFRDKYFCTQNGYEECRHVADQGNNLRERFLGLDPNTAGTFTIMETGFGTGLSFCCAWSLWEEFAPASWTLHFVSVELYPLSNEDLVRALSIWPIEVYKNALGAKYQPTKNGIQHFEFKEHHALLTIVFEDVVKGLAMLHQENIGPADAWLLNGFSPFANPLMWTREVFQGMALLSKKGTTLSTFTVASAVRRDLEAAGFTVEKFKGYGTKKEVLRGTFREL